MQAKKIDEGQLSKLLHGVMIWHCCRLHFTHSAQLIFDTSWLGLFLLWK